jgi:hypothetical protein
MQAPFMHVWFTHATGPPHSAFGPHVCALLPEHCFCPGVHAPWQTPPSQVPLVQGVGAPHCPQPPHACRSAPEHCAPPGVHTGADGQEHAPNEQAAVHVCDPYVLQACVVLGAQAPCFEQVPLLCQVPLPVHVCVSVPQLPHGTGFVCPGPHTPVHAPFTHVWPTHVTGVAHCPLDPHACAPLPEHWTCPTVHVPVQTPPSQLPLPQPTGALHCPFTQISTAAPEQRSCPDEHTLASPPLASAPASPPPLPPVSTVASVPPPSGDPVSSRSSMLAIAAHPAPVAPARPIAMNTRTPRRIDQVYHANASAPATLVSGGLATATPGRMLSEWRNVVRTRCRWGAG